MPVKSVRVSSLSGEIIPENTGARVRFIFTDPDRIDMRADLTDAEVEKVIKATKAEPVDPRLERRASPRARK